MGQPKDGQLPTGRAVRNRPAHTKPEPVLRACAGGCGKEVRGTYCRACYGQKEKRRAAGEQYENDGRILTWRAERVPVAEMAARLGVVRQRAYQRLHAARRREDVRRLAGMPLAGETLP